MSKHRPLNKAICIPSATLPRKSPTTIACLSLYEQLHTIQPHTPHDQAMDNGEAGITYLLGCSRHRCRGC
jgi:hypothetical protein